MILLTVLRPGDPPHKVTARYDDETGHWFCEDAQLYRVLKGLRLPAMRYYPDPDLALVRFAAHFYHGEVTDLRNETPHVLQPGEVF